MNPLLVEREELLKRLLRALCHLPHEQQMMIVCSFFPIDKLREIVAFQERRN